VQRVVAHAALSAIVRTLVGHRELGDAGEQLATRAERLEPALRSVVTTQQRGSGVVQVAPQEQDRPRRRRAAHHGHCRQHLHLALEIAIVRAVGNVMRHAPGERRAHRPQEQQRREHPVEQLAEERARGVGAPRKRACPCATPLFRDGGSDADARLAADAGATLRAVQGSTGSALAT
jgi:hypothetical protein